MIGDFVWSRLRKRIEDLGWCFFFFLVVDVFIVILMSYLYYFNQIAKNIDPFDIGCEEVK